MKFSSKAQTLASLMPLLQSAQIAPLVFFTVDQWRSDQPRCLSRISKEIGDDALIVRSSCLREDVDGMSNAGAFLSLKNVNRLSLERAIEDVIASYGTISGNDEVLVQPMLSDTIQSGVAFSHDPNSCTAYRVVSWVEGNDTSAITGGKNGKTWHFAARSPYEAPDELQGIIDLIDELLDIFDNVPVDCEFAKTKGPTGEPLLWLLQARPLVMPHLPEEPEKQAARLETIHQKVLQNMKPHPFLKGSRTVYGVMPDWNPAEIIGVRPKPMALSLYRELITDSIWAYQRDNYGYRNLRSFPLMVHFFGLPCVDVRLSFNSFIPATLDDGLAEKLADYYINELLNKPELHDKVEFEIVFSCYTLDLPVRLERLKDAGITQAECDRLKDSLRHLTNRIIHADNGLWKEDARKLEILKQRRSEILASDTTTVEKIYWLIEDGKRYGTLPFAGLARAAFIAVQMLKSLVAVGVFSKNDADHFMKSLNTITAQFSSDRHSMCREDILAKYGHLRPGTYDIETLRYDEAPGTYFNWGEKLVEQVNSEPFEVTDQQFKQIEHLLKVHGLDLGVDELFEFLSAAIELREMAKFHFTKNLSDVLSMIVEYGAQYGFTREDMSFCDIQVFRELYASTAYPEKIIEKSIEAGRERYKETLSTILPPVIAKPEDIWCFEWPETEPNFITQQQLTAPVVSDIKDLKKLAGMIVCIPNADPGYDWLFSYPIAGLITAWGGANSHMAIRAGEQGLPAVIGAGEKLYNFWSRSERLHIDCASRKVQVLQ